MHGRAIKVPKDADIVSFEVFNSSFLSGGISGFVATPVHVRMYGYDYSEVTEAAGDANAYMIETFK